MPTYTFYDEKSGIEWDETLSIAERTEFLEKNKHIKQKIVPVAVVGDHVMRICNVSQKRPLIHQSQTGLGEVNLLTKN